jgi:phage gp46-like protein
MPYKDFKMASNEQGILDFVVENGLVQEVSDFSSLLQISLFCDQRAEELSNIAPLRRRGFWADTMDSYGRQDTIGTGSKIWRFEQSRLDNNTVALIDDAIKTRLNTLVKDGLAQSVSTSTAGDFVSGKITTQIKLKPAGVKNTELYNYTFNINDRQESLL